MFGPMGMVVSPDPALHAAQTRIEDPNIGDSSNTEQCSLDPSLVHSQKHSKSPDDSLATSSQRSAQEYTRDGFLDTMMTQTNLLVLPPSNPSYQMAYFLKTTGPVGEPPAKPTKGKRITSAMRLFKSGHKRSSDRLTAAQQRLVIVLCAQTSLPC